MLNQANIKWTNYNVAIYFQIMIGQLCSKVSLVCHKLYFAMDIRWRPTVVADDVANVGVGLNGEN